MICKFDKLYKCQLCLSFTIKPIISLLIMRNRLSEEMS